MFSTCLEWMGRFLFFVFSKSTCFPHFAGLDMSRRKSGEGSFCFFWFLDLCFILFGVRDILDITEIN